MSLIIFTGIEGIFSALTEQNYVSVSAVIERLQQHNIPLIMVTNQTRAEAINLASEIGLDAPLIVEHGSGIFIPEKCLGFELKTLEKIDGYYLYQLGCNYTEARAALKAVQEEISKILRGFGDLDEVDIQSLLNGSVTKAHQAKAREFSEYFLTPNRVPIEQLQSVATDYGFKIHPGEKLSLMLGVGADTAQAVQWLINNYQANGDRQVMTIGLGSSVQDATWLETVQQPVIIPKVNQDSIQHQIQYQHRQTAEKTGLDSWLNFVEELVGKLNSKP